jgi:Protein of unknown function (DUF3833)
VASESVNSEGLFDITHILGGRTVAHGIFEDRFGRMRRRFTATMDGQWAGDIFVLSEVFIYDDGERETRTWKIAPGARGEFQASADECIGVAHGIYDKHSWTLRYHFRLRMRSRTLAVSCDDRVYRMTDGLSLNRVTIRKWGIKIGEVTIMFARQPDSAAPTRAAA